MRWRGIADYGTQNSGNVAYKPLRRVVLGMQTIYCGSINRELCKLAPAAQTPTRGNHWPISRKCTMRLAGEEGGCCSCIVDEYDRVRIVLSSSSGFCTSP